MLKPFFTYYGGKYRAAPRYPSPRYTHIVEPFAGSAGYSLRHYTKQVILLDKDPVIVSLWQWLIEARSQDFLSLPDIPEGVSVDSFDLRPEAKSLIGFWLNKGTVSPCKIPSRWMRDGIRPNSFWGPAIRQRLADQAGAIKHWVALLGDYSDFPNGAVTWFVDPPYNNEAGRKYRFSNVDYEHLSGWCKERKGQVIVCENSGATWLPFRDAFSIKSLEGAHGKHKSKEAMWVNDGTP